MLCVEGESAVCRGKSLYSRATIHFVTNVTISGTETLGSGLLHSW